MARRAVFNDEHDLFRETVAEFVRREIVPRRETIREQRKIDRSIWAKAGEQGLLGIGVPERYGGAGIDDFRFNAVMQEELVRAGMAYASAFQVHADVVAPYLVELTTEDQRGRWLPGFCTGELVTAIGMSEPGGGSDLAALKTTAVEDDGGWVLNGSKTFITNGTDADLVVTAARTPEHGERSISLFAVEKGMPGFAPGRKLEKVGQHEADTAELFFEDVQLPPENLIGGRRPRQRAAPHLPRRRPRCADELQPVHRRRDARLSRGGSAACARQRLQARPAVLRAGVGSVCGRRARQHVDRAAERGAARPAAGLRRGAAG